MFLGVCWNYSWQTRIRLDHYLGTGLYGVRLWWTVSLLVSESKSSIEPPLLILLRVAFYISVEFVKLKKSAKGELYFAVLDRILIFGHTFFEKRYYNSNATELLSRRVSGQFSAKNRCALSNIRSIREDPSGIFSQDRIFIFFVKNAPEFFFATKHNKQFIFFRIT